MGIVSDIISDAVATVADTVYLRATDLDANTKIAEIELEGKNFCLYNNLPTMSSLGEVSVTYEIPIEISVLKLADIDDTTLDGDTIRESLIPVAEQIFDRVVRNPTLSNLVITEDYNLSFEDQVEMYDSIMTGLKLSFNIHIDRTVFYCG
tara:strand:- start:1820 stop:2269 length:450 start_codon:yes stop_codon:yes gene_type:complete